MIGQLRNLPRAVQDVLNQAEGIEALAKKYSNARDMFFIGRNINYPIALEGALKTKEISYIHGEGFPAGELKHGPLALISKDSPVVAIAVKDHTYEKMLGNISEVSARGSPVIAIGYEGDTELQKYADDVIAVRELPPRLLTGARHRRAAALGVLSGQGARLSYRQAQEHREDRDRGVSSGELLGADAPPGAVPALAGPVVVPVRHPRPRDRAHLVELLEQDLLQVVVVLYLVLVLRVLQEAVRRGLASRSPRSGGSRPRAAGCARTAVPAGSGPSSPRPG